MKTGLFFGSFNPIHVGHMVIANYMVEFTDLEQIWFVVSPHNPLKNKNSMLADYHRIELVRRAIGDNNKMKASDIEFKLSQPSYTINTLAYLEEKYPTTQFALIIGEDNLNNFHRWKNYEQILLNYELYVYPRLISNLEEIKHDLKRHPKIKYVDAPVMEISSSFIRKSVKEKKDIRYMMPTAAFDYLQEMHFYEK